MACLPTESIRTELGVVGIRNYSRRDSLTWQHLGSQGEREMGEGEREETRSGLGDSSRLTSIELTFSLARP